MPGPQNTERFPKETKQNCTKFLLSYTVSKAECVHPPTFANAEHAAKLPLGAYLVWNVRLHGAKYCERRSIPSLASAWVKERAEVRVCMWPMHEVHRRRPQAARVEATVPARSLPPLPWAWTIADLLMPPLTDTPKDYAHSPLCCLNLCFRLPHGISINYHNHLGQKMSLDCT